MARPGGAPENMRPAPPWKPGQSGNPAGVTKHLAQVRAINQTMWALYCLGDPEYAVYAAKYPVLAQQCEKRFAQANDGLPAAIDRVDSETLGAKKQVFSFKDLDDADDETILKLASMEIPK